VRGQGAEDERAIDDAAVIELGDPVDRDDRRRKWRPSLARGDDEVGPTGDGPGRVVGGEQREGV
jgi:hypothetical protein